MILLYNVMIYLFIILFLHTWYTGKYIHVFLNKIKNQVSLK